MKRDLAWKSRAHGPRPDKHASSFSFCSLAGCTCAPPIFLIPPAPCSCPHMAAPCSSLSLIHPDQLNFINYIPLIFGTSHAEDWAYLHLREMLIINPGKVPHLLCLLIFFYMNSPLPLLSPESITLWCVCCIVGLLCIYIYLIYEEYFAWDSLNFPLRSYSLTH